MKPLDARIEAIFLEALATPADQRERLLCDRCGDDASLRADVQSLILHHEESSGLLDRAVIRSTSEDESSRSHAMDHDLPPVQQAGGYRLISILGSGGMGVVYLAEQEKPRRTVALKLIRVALASGAARRRFEHEAELLARLQHPGIAQIYEAGVADFGHGPQQFIAMELVRGEPLTSCVRARHVDVPTRLRLMIRVCDAVQHAHQRGVIHRDLKPANILVVLDDHEPSTHQGTKGMTTTLSSHGLQPKILDFGVARVLDSDVAVTTMQTSAGQLVGTVRYMSPEQIAGDAGAIDARSDVYTLGVILYELLAGRLPHLLESRSLADAARIIRDQPHTSLSSLNRSYRGDIETIVSKALEKDPRRRYQSAAELALDLERYLSNQPIIARPPSAIYSARKFVRRNKAIVSGVVIAFFALIAGIIGTTNAMLDAQQQRDDANDAKQAADDARVEEKKQRTIAERQARIAHAVNNFLNQDLLALADPMRQPDANLTLREALDRSAALVDERFKDEPEVAAAIHTTIGLAYQNLVLHDVAETHLQSALDLRRALNPPNLDEVASSVNLLAVLRFHRGRLEESEAGYKEAIAILKQKSGTDVPDLAGNLIGLAMIEQSRGNLAAAEPLVRQSLQSRIDALGENDPEVADAKDALANLLSDLGRHDESERLLRESLAIREEKQGADHYMTQLTVNNLAVLLIAREKLDEAKALLHRVLATWEDVLAPEHPAFATLHHNLAEIARRQGDVESAERELRAALVSFRKSYGDDHDHTMTTITVLAELLLQVNRPDEAEPFVREALDRRMRVSGPDHPATIVAIMDLGWLYRLRGDLEQAIAYNEQGLASRRHVIGDDHPATMRAMGQIAGLYAQAGQHDKAEALYREQAERRERVLGTDDPGTIGSKSNLARSLVALKRYSDAQPLFHAVVELRTRLLPPDHPDLAASLHDLGQNDLDLAQFDQAEGHLRQALAIRSRMSPAPIAQLRQTQLALGSALIRLEKFAEAEAILLEVHREIQSAQPIDGSANRAVLERLIALYTAWQKPEDAQRCQSLLDEHNAAIP